MAWYFWMVKYVPWIIIAVSILCTAYIVYDLFN